MKQLLLAFSICISTQLALAGAPASQAETVQKLAAFLDEWHDDAAHARIAYFDKIAADGVYIGTDKTERWLRDDFKVWAEKYFKRPVAWAFKPFNRHIAMTPDQSLIWFDEQLHTQMGICQASGVVRQTSKGFEIVHYQLSIAVPNPVSDKVIAEIKRFEQTENQPK